jgi:hypothetical protein
MSLEDEVMADLHFKHVRPVGVIDTIDGDLALVLVGQEQEPWHFPVEASCCCAGGPAPSM